MTENQISEAAQPPVDTTPAPVAVDPEPVPAKAETSYVILERINVAAPGESGTDEYQVCETIEARAADQAIRSYVETLDEGAKSGTFVAVPARSWRPVTVTPKTVTTTTLVIEEAS